MFSFLKQNPQKKLDRLYENKLEKAMIAQRNGDMRAYAMITAEAEEIGEQLRKLQKEN